MVIDSVFNVGDTVWTMMDNMPTECVITGIKFDSGVYGCDGVSRSLLSEQFYLETTVKYYIIKKRNLNSDGGYERYNVERYPVRIKNIFASKEECVRSLL